ncbi:SpoIIE family protein phosphatase [Streptomyces sp. NPDC004134]|uniref:SpoIIE family protein phosphatase n=1 Tax=Streptomyces sp. NPDC004134 TaxID=3364691 RepID=UPI00368324E5
MGTTFAVQAVRRTTVVSVVRREPAEQDGGSGGTGGSGGSGGEGGGGTEGADDADNTDGADDVPASGGEPGGARAAHRTARGDADGEAADDGGDDGDDSDGSGSGSGSTDGPGDGDAEGAEADAAAGPQGVTDVALTLAAGMPAAATARRFVRELLAGRAGPEVDDAELLTSELVTNAVVHAGTEVRVRCRLVTEDATAAGLAREGADGDGAAAEPTLLVEVTDGHAARVMPLPAPEESYGYGLQLVAALADAWGVEHRRSEKTVWFRMGPLREVGGEQADDDPAAEAPGRETGAGHDEAGAHGAHGASAVPDDAAHGRGVPHHADGSGGETVRGAHDLADDDLADPHGDPHADPHAAHAAALRLPSQATAHTPRSATDPELRGGGPWAGVGAFSFLAETSDMLAGQFDEDMVASLATQLLVPRLADWSAVWLEGADGAEPRLAQVWHAAEERISPLRRALEQCPLPPPDARPVPVSWPGGGSSGVARGPGDAGYGLGGPALACPLVAGGRRVGTLLFGRAGVARIGGDVVAVVTDFARRVAHAVSAARQYTRQVTISEVLQRGLLPSGIAEMPAMDTAVVYEPAEGAAAGGDFYDLFPSGSDRWCFAIGDVCGQGPEAAVVTGLARPVLRLLAREGYGVADVLAGLNRTLVEHAFEAVEAATAFGLPPEQARFLSLLYGELVPYEHDRGGVRCTVASAGHPLPLLLRSDGGVRAAADAQLLLGVLDDAEYYSQSFDLEPGDTLLCVTDGVTERRYGDRLFDDEDGLAEALSCCTGLGAAAVAERIRTAVHDFAPVPPRDDLAMMVLQARGTEPGGY